jgi:hypothetical protein
VGCRLIVQIVISISARAKARQICRANANIRFGLESDILGQSVTVVHPDNYGEEMARSWAFENFRASMLVARMQNCNFSCGRSAQTGEDFLLLFRRRVIGQLSAAFICNRL